MTDATQKISELPEIIYPNENFAVPIATNQNASSAETFKTTLNEIRSVLLFENAFSTIADGMAGTAKGDKFYVYTDATKYFVSGWLNAGNSATALVDNNATQLTWGTIYSIKKGSGPVVAQWIYNGGYAKGGETTITPTVPTGLSVVEVYINGDRQFKDQGFSVNDSNVVTLAGELEANDLVVVIMSSSDVTLEDLNTTLLALFSGSTGAAQIGVANGGTVQSTFDNMGVVYPSVQTVLTGTIAVNTFTVRGFYSENDGGAGVWNATGNVDASKSGTHVPASALIYDTTGKEFVLSVNSGDTVNVRANGVSDIPVSDLTNQDENFVCLGEAVNGVSSLIKNRVYDNDTHTKLTLLIKGSYFRIGKKSIEMYPSITYDLGESTLVVSPSPKNTFSVTGLKMNGFEFGPVQMATIFQKANNKPGYDDISLRKVKIIGGKIVGDHTSKDILPDACSTGTGIYAYNPLYVTIVDTWVESFHVGIILGQGSSTHLIDNMGNINYGTPTYSGIVTTGSKGSFEGARLEHVVIQSNRNCQVINESNWATMYDSCIGNGRGWLVNSSVDGAYPKYFIINLGANFSVIGGTIGNTGDASCRAAISDVYDTCKSSEYRSIYVEDQASFICVGYKTGDSYSGRARYGQNNSLSIDNISSQYRDSSSNQSIFNLVKFEEGYFGSYDSNGNWIDAVGGGLFTLTDGFTTWKIGSPTNDQGAFKHGGWDFKYGTYNIGYISTTGNPPDVDFIRGLPTANEFINPYGLQVNSGTLVFPIENPAYSSNICVWFKDITGNFSTSACTMNIVGEATNNIWGTTNGVNMIDYGNGYKCMVFVNKKESAMQPYKTKTTQQALTIVVPSSTPIILKNIQAYVGGVPMFPTGLSYTPESSVGGIWGSGGLYGTFFGGGLFKPDDNVLPNQYYIADSSNPDNHTYYGNTNLAIKRISSGNTFGDLLKSTYTGTVTAIDSTNKQTTITVPSASAYLIFTGTLAFISTYSGKAGNVGSVRVLKRKIDTGTPDTYTYTIDGVWPGAIGDTITFDNSQASYVFFNNLQHVSGATVSMGTGSPNGVVTAPLNSFYVRSDGAAGTNIYIKRTGDDDYGWVGIL